MVLGAGQWQYVLTIDHDNKTGLFTAEVFLHNHAMTGFTKRITRQHIPAGVDGFLLGRATDQGANLIPDRVAGGVWEDGWPVVWACAGPLLASTCTPSTPSDAPCTPRTS